MLNETTGTDEQVEIRYNPIFIFFWDATPVKTKTEDACGLLFDQKYAPERLMALLAVP